MELGTRVRDKLGDAVVVLGAPSDGKVALVAVASPAARRARCFGCGHVREAAPIVGGGGGGRDESAQAGGRDPAKLPDALEAARAAIRVGARRLSQPHADPCARPWRSPCGRGRLRSDRDDREPGGRARARSGRGPRPLVASIGAELVVVGLPLTLAGDEARRPRAPAPTPRDSKSSWKSRSRPTTSA